MPVCRAEHSVCAGGGVVVWGGDAGIVCIRRLEADSAGRGERKQGANVLVGDCGVAGDERGEAVAGGADVSGVLYELEEDAVVDEDGEVGEEAEEGAGEGEGGGKERGAEGVEGAAGRRGQEDQNEEG